MSFEQMIAFLREQRTSATALVINRLIEELAAANKVKNMFVKRQACVMLADWATANEIPLDIPAFFWEWTE